MSDIDFASFNPRTFEQFSQALAAYVFGAGLMVFGDGPDGGREAVFTGEVPYPGSVERWNGSIVLQAKFKQRPFRDHRDADWLVNQLEGEADRLRGLDRVPDYYVLATNIRLSGVLGKERRGGQQKLEEAFERVLAPLGVKAMHVWHEEKIANLLDMHPALLRSYGAWLSPREVLSELLLSFSASMPDFAGTMLRYLQRELRDQRATRLQQAGHVDDAPTPLESVFVDLPFGVGAERASDWMRMSLPLEEGSPAAGLLGELLVQLSTKLDPATLDATWPKSAGPAPARFLVLGGPGQGKSTVTQFLAQVARTRILLDQAAHTLTPEAKPIIEAVKRRMLELGLPIEGVRRYPVRVELPVFADALSQATARGDGLSLLDFIAGRIAKVATSPGLDVMVLRRWLAAYPWLLILDGLDEVPSSGNRSEVLTAITEFWDEAIPSNADVAMVVTTRPQGYNDDLDPALHVGLEMTRLEPSRALEYASRVVSLKIPDEERGSRIMQRLEAAASNPTTSLLMISPLQVAILLHLVDQRGIAPTDRWTLFHEYLAIVMKREQEKHAEAGRIVRERSFVIDGILRRAGLLLHLEAEKRGGAEAFLTVQRFKELARGLLQEDGHEGAELEGLVEEITSTITNRLVFLEQRTEGRIEFDVRSLQEFMAAAELMEGEDVSVMERLHALAGPTHWQHVYRIAASKAFSVRDAAKYRDAVITANTQAEAGGEGPRAIRLAGRLALELLDDGVAHDQPRYRRMLIEQALTLLELDPVVPEPRLVSALTATGHGTAAALLGPRLSAADERTRRAAWALLLACVSTREDWADVLVRERWPGDADERIRAATTPVSPPVGTVAADLIGKAIDHGPISVVATAVHRATRRARHVMDLARSTRRPFLAALGMHQNKGMMEIGVLQARNPVMRLRVLSLDGARRSGLLERPSTPQWETLNAIRSFVEQPTVGNLAAHVSSLANPAVLDAAEHVVSPWMASAATTLVSRGADPDDLSRRIDAGSFGQPDDWAKAELRWQTHGVTEDDLRVWKTGEFFGSDVAERGGPFSPSLTMNSGRGEPWSEELAKLVEALAVSPPSAPADQLAHIVTFALSRPRMGLRVKADDLARIAYREHRLRRLLGTEQVAAVTPDARLAPELLDRLAELGRAGRFLVGPEDSMLDVGSVADMVRCSGDPGMLAFACAAYASSPQRLRELAHEIAEEIDEGEDDAATLPASLVLRFAAGRTGGREVVNADLVRREETMEQHALLALAMDPQTEHRDAETLLAALVERSGIDVVDLREEALAALSGLLDRRGSGIDEASTWSRLKLPTRLHAMLRPS